MEIVASYCHFTLHAVKAIINVTPFTLGTPTMPELLSFSDEKLNIAVLIGTKHIIFGIFLMEDKTGAIVEALEAEHRGNAERINMAILQRWLQGKGLKPVTCMVNSVESK